MFKGYYRKRFREIVGQPLTLADGLGDDWVAQALRNRRLWIPLALSDYFAVAGRHAINKAHNRLLPIQRLKWRGDWLIFMEEDQGVALWGIARGATQDSNPPVWQAANTVAWDWHAEPYRLSQFLMAMWRWQETGVEERAERRVDRGRR